MKQFPKLLTAVCVVAMAAIVGCGSPKTPEKDTTKTPKTEKTHDHDHDHDKTPAKTEAQPTVPTPNENPDVKPAEIPEIPSGDAESGSTEKKGGVDLPKDPAPANAESGSTEKKGGLDLPKE